MPDNQLVRFIEFRILHVNDSPHRIALGVALGLFIAWTPAIGLHILIALVMCILLRVNKFAALTSVWISNPLTIIPIYYPNYLAGRAVLAVFHTEPGFSYVQVSELFEKSFSPSHITAGFYTAEFWNQAGSFLVQIGLELLIGGFVIGGLIAITAYFATYKFICWHREKHPHRRFRGNL